MSGRMRKGGWEEGSKKETNKVGIYRRKMSNVKPLLFYSIQTTHSSRRKSNKIYLLLFLF